MLDMGELAGLGLTPPGSLQIWRKEGRKKGERKRGGGKGREEGGVGTAGHHRRQRHCHRRRGRRDTLWRLGRRPSPPGSPRGDTATRE